MHEISEVHALGWLRTVVQYLIDECGPDLCVTGEISG